jgi:hypothetical protein
LEITFEENVCVISSTPELVMPESTVSERIEHKFGKVGFGVCEAVFLVLLCCSLLAEEVRTWRFWRSAKRYRTFWSNGEWVTHAE